MGGGFLCEEVKCSETDDKPLSCTFYRVDFIICELDSDLKIVIDKGVVF